MLTLGNEASPTGGVGAESLICSLGILVWEPIGVSLTFCSSGVTLESWGISESITTADLGDDSFTAMGIRYSKGLERRRVEWHPGGWKDKGI